MFVSKAHIDEVVKSLHLVTPAKAGVQKCLKLLHSGLRRELSRTIKSGMTKEGCVTFYESIHIAFKVKT